MIYQFDQFELDTTRFELREEGAVQPLEPQVFTLLAYLIEHRERLVSKDELFENIWDGRIVTDSALTSRVKSARQAVGDCGKAQRFIKTVYGRGFRFVADVQIAQGTGLVLTAADTHKPDISIETSLVCVGFSLSPGAEWIRFARPSSALLASITAAQLD